MQNNPNYNALNHTILTESDLRLILRDNKKSNPIWINVQKGVSVVVISAIAFLAINFGAIREYYTQGSSDNVVATSPVTQNTSQTIDLNNIVETTPTPTTAPEPTPQTVVVPNSANQSIPANTLAINSLGISVPITWDVNFDAKLISADLKNGVVHLKDSAKPGDNGMIIISGHSSNYPWVKSSYNSVFAPLLKTKIGETIEISYNGQIYKYTITKKYEVKPDRTDLLFDKSSNGIRLITCTPIGTSLKRLIVEATPQ